MRWLIVPLIFVLGIFFAVTCAAEALPPTKSCTCGPTCPTPAPSTKWPIPASMEKLHGK